MVEEVDGKVVNENGDVAVAYYLTTPHVIKVRQTDYYFGVSYNICMSWIQPEHVDTILRTKKVCCGNQKKTVYRLLDLVHVRRWLGEISR